MGAERNGATEIPTSDNVMASAAVETPQVKHVTLADGEEVTIMVDPVDPDNRKVWRQAGMVPPSERAGDVSDPETSLEPKKKSKTHHLSEEEAAERAVSEKKVPDSELAMMFAGDSQKRMGTGVPNTRFMK